MNVEALAKLCLRLCEIPSPTGEEKLIADHIEAWAYQHFPPQEVVRIGHSLVLGRLESHLPSIGLFGHLDTVPAHPQGTPFRIEEGKVWGRGSTDMKSGVAVMMGLAMALKQLPLPFNLIWVFYEAEEGSYEQNGLGPLMQNLPSLHNMAFGIALEPTDQSIMLGCMGSMHLSLTLQGKAAHSARPWQGENAIHAAGPLLSMLLAQKPQEVKVEGYAFYEVLSATWARGGKALNVIPEQFELNLNYRFAPGKTIEEAFEEMKTLLGPYGYLHITDASPPGKVCTQNPLFQKLLRDTALPTRPKQAWTDVGRLSTLGIEAVNFGPGETTEAHQQNECATLESIAHVYACLHKFLSTP
ncbi:MAG: succinyl-diaminopimelate desuccinylase [Cystobacterineae bacterium]|nr:succinyl-diaminopimelate desuccinylase [Cystobacterineae bacterium]